MLVFALKPPLLNASKTKEKHCELYVNFVTSIKRPVRMQLSRSFPIRFFFLIPCSFFHQSSIPNNGMWFQRRLYLRNSCVLRKAQICSRQTFKLPKQQSFRPLINRLSLKRLLSRNLRKSFNAFVCMWIVKKKGLEIYRRGVFNVAV